MHLDLAMAVEVTGTIIATAPVLVRMIGKQDTPTGKAVIALGADFIGLINAMRGRPIVKDPSPPGPTIGALVLLWFGAGFLAYASGCAGANAGRADAIAAADVVKVCAADKPPPELLLTCANALGDLVRVLAAREAAMRAQVRQLDAGTLDAAHE